MHGRLLRRDNDVRVDIVDNGIGIGEPQLIFEKFRQAGDTTTRKPQGTFNLPASIEAVTSKMVDV